MGLNLGSGLAGAAGGLAVGGPVGAGLGFLGGIFGGGGGEQTTTVQRREWSPEERQAVEAIMRQYPGALEAMTPEARQEIFGRISSSIRERGMHNLDRQFAAERGRQDQAFARSGGSLGSIDLYRRNESARAYSEAASGIDLNAILGGEQVAGARANEAFNRVNTLGSQYAGFDAMRNIGQTTTGSDNPMNLGAGLLGMAAGNENSWINQQFS